MRLRFLTFFEPFESFAMGSAVDGFDVRRVESMASADFFRLVGNEPFPMSLLFLLPAF